MSVHDALEVWQQGKISDGEACKLTGMHRRQKLYTLCRKSDVKITDNITERERAAIEAAMKATSADAGA
jgi:hypothetical protein